MKEVFREGVTTVDTEVSKPGVGADRPGCKFLQRSLLHDLGQVHSSALTFRFLGSRNVINNTSEENM